MSKVIRIDDDVWENLVKRAQPLVDSPNDVLRRVFGLPERQKDEMTKGVEVKPTGTSFKRIRKAVMHPRVKDEHGAVLDESIKSFADRHDPLIKYIGMRNALDVLTACKSPNGEAYDFHYKIIKYLPDGIYIKRISGPGHRTSNEEMQRLIREGG